MAKKGVEGKVKDFCLKDVVKRFGERDQSSDLSGLKYDLAHYLFDLLKNSSSGRDLTVGELSEISIEATNQLNENYLVMDKRKY